MSSDISLDRLWEEATSGNHVFRAEAFADLPEAARRYLEHAIAPGTWLASAVRLRMHGEIKLKGWLPFEAEEVLCWKRGIIWQATVRMCGLPIRGWDRFVDGAGAMQWKMLGLFPVMQASGPDITRSAAGRVLAESVWLPSALCGEEVCWKASDALHPRACVSVPGHRAELALSVYNTGRLKTLCTQRWGNPGGREFHDADFGGVVEEEGTFGGYTIPTRLRIGWYFGTDRFDSEGEFFRVTIDDAVYR